MLFEKKFPPQNILWKCILLQIHMCESIKGKNIK
jgi:hypothetical protein